MDRWTQTYAHKHTAFLTTTTCTHLRILSLSLTLSPPLSLSLRKTAVYVYNVLIQIFVNNNCCCLLSHPWLFWNLCCEWLLCLVWSVVVDHADVCWGNSPVLQVMFFVTAGFTRANSVAVSDKITTIDRVTWRERKLFFATATSHMKNGCPLLALEVMTRLPPTMDSEREQDSDASHTTVQNEVSNTHFTPLPTSLLMACHKPMNWT